MTPALQRLFAYACLALSMSLVGSYVALSKPLVAAIPVFLLAWLRFGIGGLAMLHWLRKPADEPPMTRADPAAGVPRVLSRQFPVFHLHAVRREPDQRGVGGRHHGVDPRRRGAAELGLPARAHRPAHLGRDRAGRARHRTAGPVTAGCRSGARRSRHSGRRGKAWLGNLLVFGAVLCEASYAVIGKKLTGALGPKRITSLINLWGFALVTPFGAYAALHFDFAGVQPGIWLLLVFYSLAASVWTVWLWMTGLKVVPAAQGGVFTVMLPVSAALVGVFVLGEPLGGAAAAGFGRSAWRAWCWRRCRSVQACSADHDAVLVGIEPVARTHRQRPGFPPRDRAVLRRAWPNAAASAPVP